jgi:alkylation response protein AidB-like acyl-CoA dehydrogenase
MSFDDRDSNIDLPASPYTLLGVDADGLVHTHQGPMSVAAIESLLVQKMTLWMADQAHHRLEPATGEPYESMIDVASLLAELDLRRARALWRQHAPAASGIARLLDEASEPQEVRYLKNLATQRALDADRLALHILEEAEFMSEWALARRQLIATAAD